MCAVARTSEAGGDKENQGPIGRQAVRAGDATWDEENHPNLVNADAAPVGHGVLVWFEVDDFDAAVARARALGAAVVDEPHVNPAPNHREMWLRDPDGYVVAFASPDGEAG